MFKQMAQLTPQELGVLLGAIFVAFGTLLGGFYKFAQKQMNEARQERKEERELFTKALERQAVTGELIAVAVDKNTEKSDEGIKVSRELSDFMKRLNGTLPKAVGEKQKET